MALSIPVDFQTRSRIRNAEYVAVVNIYYSGLSTYDFSTKSCVIDGSQYLGIVESISALNESWNLFDENNVSISVPTVTLQDYTSEIGYNSYTKFSDLFGQAGLIGSRIKISVGYIGTALSSFVKLFDGTIENIIINDKIDIECRSNELPDDNINGRQLSYKLQTIGDVSVSDTVSIPKEADGLYLPVVFGQHWNSPLVCFNEEKYVELEDGLPSFQNQTYWCENDTDYQPNGLVIGDISHIKKVSHPNLGTSGYVVYLYQEGESTEDSKAYFDTLDGDQQLDGYVPGYEIGYRGGRNFNVEVFNSGVLSLPGLQLNYPTASGGLNLNYTWFMNVPLRMYPYGGKTNFLASGIVSHDSTSNLLNIFDGNENTSWSYTSSGISDLSNDFFNRDLIDFPTAVSGVGTPRSVYIMVELPVAQNLRTDEHLAVHKNRPIFTPEKPVGAGGEYNMVLMGRTSLSYTASGGSSPYGSWPNHIPIMYAQRYFYAFIGTPPDIDDLGWAGEWNPEGPTVWGNFIGATFFGRNANLISYGRSFDPNYGYNYLSYPFIYNLNSSGHLIDFANDSFELFDEEYGEGDLRAFPGDAGNCKSTTPYWMGTYPFLQRKVLNKGINGIFQFGAQVWSGLVTERLHDLYWEAYESVPYDLDGYLYTHISGITIDNSDLVMLSADAYGPINGYMLKRPNEYLEFIYQSKISGGLDESSYNYNEWALSDDDWREVYGTVRDRSGFTLIEETSCSQFVKEYCKDELFTSYRDNLNKFRFSLIPRDPLNITINSIIIDGKDLTNSSTYYSPIDKLCAEVKSVKTDYVYANQTYVNDSSWKIYPNGNYNYAFWKSTNSYAKNSFVKDSIEKKYTSYTDPSIVLYSGVYYTCQLSHTSATTYTPSHSSPGWDDGRYWIKCASGLVPPTGAAWVPSTSYYGYDAEARAIASLYINQWCNLHRMVDIETNVLDYYQLEIGDIVEFINMPKTWAGLTIKGWAGDTTTSGVVVNGQTVTHKGIVTSVTRTTSSIKATVMQLHVLDDILVTRVK